MERKEVKGKEKVKREKEGRKKKEIWDKSKDREGWKEKRKKKIKK